MAAPLLAAAGKSGVATWLMKTTSSVSGDVTADSS
jgi:hypothetical protein